MTEFIRSRRTGACDELRGAAAVVMMQPADSGIETIGPRSGGSTSRVPGHCRRDLDAGELDGSSRKSSAANSRDAVRSARGRDRVVSGEWFRRAVRHMDSALG